MTKKEFNAIRTALYSAAMENEEVNTAVNINGCAYIYEITQLPDIHKYLVLTHKTQLNSVTLKENGFDPDKAVCELKFTLQQRTKCADF